jgi:transposase
MAYREYGMWEILDVLRRIHRGETQKAIEAATGRTRKTIRRYLRAAEKLGWSAPSQEPTEELASKVLRKLRPGPEPGFALVDEVLGPHREDICRWLSDDGGEPALTLVKVHELLTRRWVSVSYSSLHRYAVRECGFRAKATTVRMAEVAPGELAEVDFGRLGLIYDPEVERKRVCHALVVTLVHSRHQYVHLTHSQKLPDLIEGLEDAWAFFGGVPARVVIDNLKAAVCKADRYEPIFQRTFEEYARYRGFVIDAAIAGHAQGKPHVERAVPYVRGNFFRGEQWLNLAHAQREAIAWCSSKAGLRTHGTTHKQPLVVFEDVEKAALRSLTGPRFDTPRWATCKVHPDHHIRFGKALYSVPHAYLRKQVDVRGDKSLVRIYFRGELVKTHPSQPPGGRDTDHSDYPEEKTAYTMRDPNRMISEGRRHGREIGRFLEQLLAGTFPWAKLRQAQKLMRMVQKYGAERVDAACGRALSFEIVNVYRVERILKKVLEASPSPGQGSGQGQLVLFPGRFLRPADSFTQPHIERKEKRDGDPNLP